MGRQEDFIASPVARSHIAKMHEAVNARIEQERREVKVVEELEPADEEFFAKFYAKHGMDLYRPTTDELTTRGKK